MQQIANQLRDILTQHYDSLLVIPESSFSAKSSPLKWSKKEIMGHLIDSAQNNIRRFIEGQYADNPHIVYNQDQWVALSHYQQWETGNIIDLWYLLNNQICFILQNISEEQSGRMVVTKDPHSIAWLGADYIKHLLHHLHVVLDLDPVPYG